MPGAAVQPIDASSPGGQSGQYQHLLPVHTTVPGRARFRVDALYRAEQLKDQIEACLRELDGVRSAKINILSASVVVHFDPAVPHPEIAASIDKESAGLSLPRQAPSPPQGQPNGLTDARLLETENLTVDESALTGESMPVEKDRVDSCYPARP